MGSENSSEETKVRKHGVVILGKENLRSFNLLSVEGRTQIKDKLSEYVLYSLSVFMIYNNRAATSHGQLACRLKFLWSYI